MFTLDASEVMPPSIEALKCVLIVPALQTIAGFRSTNCPGTTDYSWI